jgi:branched-chain amino acid transport system substrate-binding protein
MGGLSSGRRRRGGSRLLAPVVAAVVGLSACSSGGSTGATSGPIVIGGTSDLSAQFSTNGRGLQAGLQIAVDSINKSGGIDGRQLKLVFLDDAAQVSRGVANATQLITQEGAVVIAGHLLSNICKATQPVTAAKDVPMVCNSGDPTQFDDPPDPNVYQPIVLQPRETPAMFAVADKVVTAPQPRAAFIGLASAAIQALQNNQKQEATRRGWPIVRDEIVPLTATDLNAQVSAISAAKPDVVFANLADATSILLIRGLRAAGVTAPIIGSDSSTTVAAETTKDEHYYVVEALSTGGTPGAGYQKFLDAGAAAGIDPSKPFVSRGYQQGMLIAAALKACNACSGQKLIDAFDQLHLDTEGLTAGPVTFTRNDHVGVHTMYTFRYDPAAQKATLFASGLPVAAA